MRSLTNNLLDGPIAERVQHVLALKRWVCCSVLHHLQSSCRCRYHSIPIRSCTWMHSSKLHRMAESLRIRDCPIKLFLLDCLLLAAWSLSRSCRSLQTTITLLWRVLVASQRVCGRVALGWACPWLLRCILLAWPLKCLSLTRTWFGALGHIVRSWRISPNSRLCCPHKLLPGLVLVRSGFLFIMMPNSRVFVVHLLHSHFLWNFLS